MKIGQLYNLDAFEKLMSSGKASGFTDSASGVVLERSLTQVDPRIFEKKYPELAFVNSGVEVNNAGGYAQKIQSLRLQDLGEFKNAGDKSSNKGKISLSGEQSFLNVVEREAHSIWTDTEIEQANLQNVNLVSQYMSAHNKIYMREVDESGLLGLNGNEGVLTSTAYVSSAASGAIDTLNAQQMYDEYAGLIVDQRNAVNNTPEYSCDVVITPNYCINALSSTMMNTAAGNGSVLTALQANMGVRFIGSFRCDDAGGVGVSVTAALSTNSESVVMRIPEPLTIGEIIKVGSFHFKVDSKYRIGGADVLEATSGRLLTGL